MEIIFIKRSSSPLHPASPIFILTKKANFIYPILLISIFISNATSIYPILPTRNKLIKKIILFLLKINIKLELE